SVTPSAVDFGNHHVGDVLSQTVTITNAAPADGFSELLDVQISGSVGAITAGGTIAGLAAGATDTGLAIGLPGTADGAFSGAAILALTSNGGTIDGLGTTALSAQTI